MNWVFDFILRIKNLTIKNPCQQKFIALKNKRTIFEPVLTEFGVITYLWETVLKPLWSFFSKQRTVEVGVQGLEKIIKILQRVQNGRPNNDLELVSFSIRSLYLDKALLLVKINF